MYELSNILLLLSEIKDQSEMAGVDTKITMFSTYGESGNSITVAITSDSPKIEDFGFVYLDGFTYINNMQTTLPKLKDRLNRMDIELQIIEELNG